MEFWIGLTVINSIVIAAVIGHLVAMDRERRGLVRRREEIPMTEAQTTLPWRSPPLDEWAIIGMNHYHQNGAERIFVAMVRNDRCIKAEGADTEMLWDELRHKAGCLGGRGDG